MNENHALCATPEWAEFMESEVLEPVTSGRRHRVTRRDLLLEIGDLDRLQRASSRVSKGRARGLPRSRPASAEAGDASVQLALDLGESDRQQVSGLPEMTDADRVRAELDILGLDASRHVVDFHAPFLDRLGITRSVDLLSARSRSELLVAGVKVATQTPPIRSGRRVIFLTLDDATGPVDATFFEDVQGPYAATVFGSWLLVVRGELRRTGRRGVSLRATGAWDLGALHDLWRRRGWTPCTPRSPGCPPASATPPTAPIMGRAG